MDRTLFLNLVSDNAALLTHIRSAAHQVHADVNQYYGDSLPYAFHLDRVAAYAQRFGHLILQVPEHIPVLFFGVFFHDSIEDARLTYNDVLRIAQELDFSQEQAFLAAEIVYALTNEKGRTRQERANEKYYKGIRQTPYAPFCKMCDRLANLSFSVEHTDAGNQRMLRIYRQEHPDFVRHLLVDINADASLQLPSPLLQEANQLLQEVE